MAISEPELSVDFTEARHRFRREWNSTTSYPALLRLSRDAERLTATAGAEHQLTPVRLALLSDATVDFIVPLLKGAIVSLGLRPLLCAAPYDQAIPALLDPQSPLVTFGPQVTIVFNTAHHIPEWPAFDTTLEQVENIVDGVCHWLLDPCKIFHERTGSEIVLNNFHPLRGRAAGNLSARLPGDRTNFIRRVNLALGDRAPRYVHLHDVASLAEWLGLEHWFDPRYWFLAKQPVSFACVAECCRNLAAIVGAIFGRSKKCLVLDLDNTLWGGVIGDDGLGGIQIGEGSQAGEAFKAFQQYLRTLKERGVLLAVCSKNDEPVAKLAFAGHPEMVLRLEDFVAFRANWRPKSENIRAIARELDLPLEAIVFVDDNPAERDEVAQALPEVTVLDLPVDAAEFPAGIEAGRFFEIVSLTREDLNRTTMYQSRRATLTGLTEASDLRTFLASLQMAASIRPFDEVSFERITELTNKTNQFNLTTRRVVSAEIRRMASDPSWLTRSLRLKDRFGDHGLVSVVFGPIDGVRLILQAWLMSCRVLNRGVEELLFNHLLATARERNIHEIVGWYRPTERNSLVKDHYQKLGFTRVTEIDGVEWWRLAVADALPLETFVRDEDSEPLVAT